MRNVIYFFLSQNYTANDLISIDCSHLQSIYDDANYHYSKVMRRNMKHHSADQNDTEFIYKLPSIIKMVAPPKSCGYIKCEFTVHASIKESSSKRK